MSFTSEIWFLVLFFNIIYFWLVGVEHYAYADCRNWSDFLSPHTAQLTLGHEVYNINMLHLLYSIWSFGYVTLNCTCNCKSSFIGDMLHFYSTCLKTQGLILKSQMVPCCYTTLYKKSQIKNKGLRKRLLYLLGGTCKGNF